MKTILVADDNTPFRKALAEILEMEGYLVIQATDSREAASILKEERPDIIITDLVMDGMSSPEYLDALNNHAISHDTPILIVTGALYPNLPCNLQVARLFHKPFDYDEMLATVATLTL